MMKLVFLLLSVVSYCTVDAFVGLKWSTKLAMRDRLIRKTDSQLAAGFGASAATAPFLLPDPIPNSIGNFFDNSTEAVKFIQCYMLNVAQIEDKQYGVGFPVDMAVMLGYFEGNELVPVKADYPDYEHLINHVANQVSVLSVGSDCSGLLTLGFTMC